MKSTNRLGALLKKELDTKKTGNPDYSLRKLGKDLGMNSGILSSIMAGKRKVSYELAERVCTKMGIPPAEIVALLAEPDISQKVSIKIAKKEYYEILSDISFTTLYALLKTSDFKTDVRWIAERIQVSEDQVVEMIRKMVKVGILKFDENSQLTRAENVDLQHLTEVSDAMDDLIMALMKKAIEYYRVRDDLYSEFPLMTLPINSSKIFEFRKRNLKHLMECFEFLQEGERDQVYAFAQQFIPITKRDKITS